MTPPTEHTPSSEVAPRGDSAPPIALPDAHVADILERITDAFLAVDTQWRITYMNAHALALGNLRAQDAVGKVLWDVVPELVGTEVEQHYRTAMREQRVVHFEGAGVRSGKWQATTIYPSPEGLAVFGRDVSERRRAEAELRENEARKTAILESALDSIITMDDQGRVVDFNSAAERTFGYTRREAAGRPLAEIVIPPRLRASHQRGLAEFMRSGRGPILGKRLEMMAWRRDGSEFPVELTVTHTMLEDGRPFFTGYIRDISERRAVEERQRLLAAELGHRVKNTLATVLAIADQTASSVNSPSDFVPAFSGRVASISRLHDRLSRSHWKGAPLRQIVELALSPYSDAEGRRTHLSGEPVMVPSPAATCLCITLHELATNAAKYGALSAPEGSVRVDWGFGPQDDLEGAHGIRLEWLERGGPPVRPPERRGFGTRLITGGIPYELHGKADLRYDEPGVSCRLVWPVERANPSTPGPGQEKT